MTMRHLVAALSMLTASTAALADVVDINLNNNTAQFQFGTGSASDTQGETNLHAGLLYNNANSVLTNAGILVISSQGNAPGLNIGAGVEVLAAVIKDNPLVKSNASAVALDGLVRYSPPAAEQLAFAGEVHYAPRIITFGDATRYSQVGARVEYAISPQTVVYAGYRRVAFGIKPKMIVPGVWTTPTAVLDNGAHLGLRLSF